MATTIELLDADDNGIDSFADLIRAGLIKHTVVPSFAVYDRTCLRILADGAKISMAAVEKLKEKNLKPEQIAELTALIDFPLKNHLCIIDTATSLMLTTITDAKIGNDPTKELWTDPMRSKYLNDPQYLTVYNLGTQLILRRMKNLRSRGARLTVTAHEDEQIDLITQMRKRAPQANKALYEGLMSASSDVFRLEVKTEEVRDQAGNVVVPIGMRVLRLKANSDIVAKVHVERQFSDKLPPVIADPTMTKVFETLHKEPSFLLLYSPPGCGKTTLALSEVGNIKPPPNKVG